LDKYAIIISSLVIHSGIQLELLIWTYGIRVISEAYSVRVSKCDRKRYGGCSQGVTSASYASDFCNCLSVPPITESGPSWSLAVTESSYFWETLLESSSQKNPARLHSSDSNSNRRWVNNFLNVFSPSRTYECECVRFDCGITCRLNLSKKIFDIFLKFLCIPKCPRWTSSKFWKK
jgi:hypothetical protein